MEIVEKYSYLMKDADCYAKAAVRLKDIIHILRMECPWDKVQTYESLKKCMIEEAYEAVEAINQNDMKNFEEELGDVMLQVYMNSEIAEEKGDFSIVDVINSECNKMIRRHPHIFLKENIKTIDKVLEKWENIKGKEKGQQSYSEKLASIPRALPALIRSYKVQAKAAHIGFDWDDISGALDKIEEETTEFRVSCINKCQANMIEELGDLIFSIVNVARFLEIDPEEALNLSTDKFLKRFMHMEEIALCEGLDLEKMTLAEMDVLWDKAKALNK